VAAGSYQISKTRLVKLAVAHIWGLLRGLHAVSETILCSPGDGRQHGGHDGLGGLCDLLVLHSLSVTHIHTHAHTLSLSHTHTCTHTLSLSLSLALSLTHTLMQVTDDNMVATMDSEGYVNVFAPALGLAGTHPLQPTLNLASEPLFPGSKPVGLLAPYSWPLPRVAGTHTLRPQL
jgi:hypothetical protein